MNRKIAVVTSTRAEYGLLLWVMDEIRQAPGLDLQVIATGAHLSPEFGLTYREIEKDGFHIDRRIEILLNSDTPIGLAKSMGLAMIGFGEAIAELRPDLMVVLGDRYEIFAAAAAATVARLPIAHLHGGEITEGAFDDVFRHSLTKMSHLHFVAAEEYRQRVLQLGEQPDRVFLVGGLGLDNIEKLPLLDRASLEAALGFELGQKSLLVTFHPATLHHDSAGQQFQELLAAFDGMPDTSLIFTMPNADTGSRELFALIEQYVGRRSTARAYVSLGQQLYLSCMAQVDAVVGNSSSGLIEAPTLHKGTVNIGDRQHGRLKAASVIDCAPERSAISAALRRLYSPEFQGMLAGVINPYGAPGASAKVVSVLRDAALENILKKSFCEYSN